MIFDSFIIGGDSEDYFSIELPVIKESDEKEWVEAKIKLSLNGMVIYCAFPYLFKTSDIACFHKMLSTLYADLSTTITIELVKEKFHIEMTGNGQGKIEVRGRLHVNSDNLFIFDFITDQTFLPHPINVLSRFLQDNENTFNNIAKTQYTPTCIKTKPIIGCTQCGTIVKAINHTQNNGLCTQCKRWLDAKENVIISCKVKSLYSPAIFLEINAYYFQPIINNMVESSPPYSCNHSFSNFNNEDIPLHPSHFELEAQCALIRHAIYHRIDFQLHNDHWGKTGFKLLEEFEKGNAWIRIKSKKLFFNTLTKKEWRQHISSLDTDIGFEYRDKNNNLIFKDKIGHYHSSFNDYEKPRWSE